MTHKIDNGQVEASRHGVARSPEWPKVEKAHREKQPHCIACHPDSKGKIQVHHVFPFHYAIALGRPDLELDDRNLVSLCETEEGTRAENHHLLIGHLGDFKEGNLDVVKDATVTFFGHTEDEIKTSNIWISGVQNRRLKALDLMSDQEKKELRALMDSTFPLIPKEE